MCTVSNTHTYSCIHNTQATKLYEIQVYLHVAESWQKRYTLRLHIAISIRAVQLQRPVHSSVSWEFALCFFHICSRRNAVIDWQMQSWQQHHHQVTDGNKNNPFEWGPNIFSVLFSHFAIYRIAKCSVVSVCIPFSLWPTVVCVQHDDIPANTHTIRTIPLHDINIQLHAEHKKGFMSHSRHIQLNLFSFHFIKCYTFPPISCAYTTHFGKRFRSLYPPLLSLGAYFSSYASSSVTHSRITHHSMGEMSVASKSREKRSWCLLCHNTVVIGSLDKDAEEK